MPDGLRLREDIAILTFNYDPCLQYHLWNRLWTRNQINPSCNQSDAGGRFQIQYDGIFSGIGNWPERSWSRGPFMPVIQLHGAILYPSQLVQGDKIIFGEVPQFQLFKPEFLPTMRALCRPSLENPPLLFPFELFDADGQFVPQEGFPVTRNAPHGQETLHEMFRYIWEYAKTQVQLADKVSFVGMSWHEFLEPGLKFLFRDKTGPTQMVIANPEVQQYAIDHSRNICTRTQDFLTRSPTGGCCVSSLPKIRLHPRILFWRRERA